MHIRRPRTWKGFEDVVERIRTKYRYKPITLSNGDVGGIRSRILFRGQANAKWSLKTTLEREANEAFSVSLYHAYAASGGHEIESLTGTDWKLKTPQEVEREIDERHDRFRITLPSYDYMVYLRHHGFPSPLLDWTESPYIAAFFAYATSRDSDVAIYCYVEYAETGKVFTEGSPFITVLGPHVRTHKRHFAQKAWYTVCSKWDDNGKCQFFCNHEDVFSLNAPEQDLLFKIILPKKLRADALNRLDDFNINYFTLFQSEDSLINTIAMRRFALQNV